MEDETVNAWRMTSLSGWWATPVRRMGLAVSAGCVVVMWLFGALAHSESAFFLGAIGAVVAAIFLLALQMLDMMAELIRVQRLLLAQLKKQSGTPS